MNEILKLAEANRQKIINDRSKRVAESARVTRFRGHQLNKTIAFVIHSLDGFEYEQTESFSTTKFAVETTIGQVGLMIHDGMVTRTYRGELPPEDVRAILITFIPPKGDRFTVEEEDFVKRFARLLT